MADVWPPKIDKNIPIPKSNGKWVFLANMEVDDSCFVLGATSKTAPGKINALADKLGFTFTCHNVIENGKKGVRIWRKS